MIPGVYIWLAPRTLQPVYIGKAKYCVFMRNRKRFKGQFSASDQTLSTRWLRKQRRLGLTPNLELLEYFPYGETDPKGLNDRERWWIKTYREAGFKLKNVTEGGDGCGQRHTPKTRAKIAAANRGKTRSPEARKRMSVGLKHFWASEEGKATRRRIVERVVPPEVRAARRVRLNELRLAKTFTPEERELRRQEGVPNP